MLDIYDYIDLAEAVANEIETLPVMKQYKELQHKIATDPHLQTLVRHFGKAKEHYEDIQRFGEYYPQKDEVRADLVKAKSALFEDSHIKAFKSCEKEIQMILDDLSRAMEEVVSFDTGKKAGGCCSGGSCSCK